MIMCYGCHLIRAQQVIIVGMSNGDLSVYLGIYEKGHNLSLRMVIVSSHFADSISRCPY